MYNFSILECDYEKLNAWFDSKKDKHDYGNNIGRYSYTFRPISTGTEITVIDTITKEKICLDNCRAW
jgi:hypothetical protein